MTKWIYRFGDGTAEGRADMRNLLGGKGAGLAEMSNLGLPVPPGFTITTEVCSYFYSHGKTYPDELREEVKELVTALLLHGRYMCKAEDREVTIDICRQGVMNAKRGNSGV